MRTVFATAMLFVLTLLGCGALKNLPEFNTSVSGLRVDNAIAPADGVTSIQIRVELRYTASAGAPHIPVALNATGANVKFAATTGVTDANGIFSTTVIGSTPGVVRLMANIQGQPSPAALQTTVQFVSVAAGASLALGPQATVGVPETAVLTILDADGQRVLYYKGTVGFSSSDPLATLPGVYQFTTADQGQHSFDGVTFATSGTQSLRVGDPSNPNVAASVEGITVYLKTAPMLEVSGLLPAKAGTLNAVKVRAVDISNLTHTDYRGTVHFTSTDPMAQLPADTVFSAMDAGVKVLPMRFKTAGIQSVSALDSGNLAINGTQSGIPVFVLADRLRVVADAAPIAGATLSVHVAAVDAYNNVDPNYSGIDAFSSSDPRASLASAIHFGPSDMGEHDAHVTFYTAGHQTLHVQDANAGFSGDAALNVVGAQAVRLTLMGPSDAYAGTLVTMLATAFDAYDNVSVGYRGTLILASSDVSAMLPGPIAVTSVNAGFVTLTNVALRTAGTQTVTVTDANLNLSANAQIQVNNAAAARLALSGLIASAAGTAQSASVSALDAYGNPAIDYLGSMVVTSDDSQAQLPQGITFVSADAGTRALAPVVLKTAGLPARQCRGCQQSECAWHRSQYPHIAACCLCACCRHRQPGVRWGGPKCRGAGGGCLWQCRSQLCGDRHIYQLGCQRCSASAIHVWPRRCRTSNPVVGAIHLRNANGKRRLWHRHEHASAHRCARQRCIQVRFERTDRWPRGARAKSCRPGARQLQQSCPQLHGRTANHELGCQCHLAGGCDS